MLAGLQLFQVETVNVAVVQHAGRDVVAQFPAAPLRAAEQRFVRPRLQQIAHGRHPKRAGQQQVGFLVQGPGGMFVIPRRERLAVQELTDLEKIEEGKKYDLEGGVAKVKEIASAKFDETVELTVWLGVDPRKADQLVRGTLVLPHGLGKSKTVLVIAQGEKVKEAERRLERLRLRPPTEAAERAQERLDQINQQLQTAAPGSAAILEAQASAWLVRANAYTQSALAELVRVRSIELANQGAQVKFSSAHTSTLHSTGGQVLQQGVH